ncbi:MAG: hypothetical protein QNJ53_23405 [Pleurocapsa sp. MO_192.B19]|nr:hypothetical protein [Pleurocapsa sp. MO_192.B19]
MPIFALENNAIEFFVKEKVNRDRDLQSEVRSKLETNLATALLAVKSSQGIVSVAGMV